MDGERAPVSVSLSHRAGRALAVVAHAPAVVGCDLERVEPRSGAFVREWLAPAEQGLLAAHARGRSRAPDQSRVDGQGGGREGPPRGAAARRAPRGRRAGRRRRRGRRRGVRCGCSGTTAVAPIVGWWRA